MSTLRGLAVALLVGLASCAPGQSVDRVSVDGSLTVTGGSGGSSQEAGMGGAGVEGGTSGTAGAGGSAGGPVDAQFVDRTADRRAEAPPPDRAPDRAPDTRLDTAPPPPPPPPPPDAAPDLPPPPPDAAPDLALPRVAQLVVGDTAALGDGDAAIRALLTERLPGFTIRLRDDGGAVDLTNTRLIVIAGSVDSATVGSKYRDVPVPVISLEYSLFDSLGMTGATENTNLGVVAGTQIEILEDTHPLAAGLAGGAVAVASASANLSWGDPAPAAVRVASLVGRPDRATVFAYLKADQMVTGVAPARRLGLFALETAAARLTDDGRAMLAAAIDWALLPD
jgi:hypothetical protein